MKFDLSHITLLEHRRRPGPDPGRDWPIVLVAFLLLLAASVGANLFFYRATAAGGSFNGAASVTPPATDTAPLAKVAQVFSARAVESAKYENGAYSFIDPSQ